MSFVCCYYGSVNKTNVWMEINFFSWLLVYLRHYCTFFHDMICIIYTQAAHRAWYVNSKQKWRVFQKVIAKNACPVDIFYALAQTTLLHTLWERKDISYRKLKKIFQMVDLERKILGFSIADDFLLPTCFYYFIDLKSKRIRNVSIESCFLFLLCHTKFP